MKQRVIGIGGIFFKTADPERTKAWYRDHLGIEASADGAVCFEWREEARPERKGMTVWSPFAADTKYFDPTTAPFMINYRVEDLDAVLAALRAEGVAVDEKVEDTDYGRFAWVTDSDGRRVELWEPPDAKALRKQEP